MAARVLKVKTSRRSSSDLSRSRPHIVSSTKSRPERRPFYLSVENLCEAKCWPALAAIGHEANAQEAEDHHRPGRGLRNAGRWSAETLSTSNAFPLLVNVTDVNGSNGKLNVPVCVNNLPWLPGEAQLGLGDPSLRGR